MIRYIFEGWQDRLVDIGRQLVAYRAGITARAFAASQRRVRGR